MAWFFTCYNPCQNSHNGKNKLTGKTPTKDSNRYTSAPAAIRVTTPVVAPVLILFAISGFANSSMIRYLEDNLQRIFRTILDFRPLAPILALVVAAVPHYEGLRERLLKVWFLDIYWDKINLECYNFF